MAWTFPATTGFFPPLGQVLFVTLWFVRLILGFSSFAYPCKRFIDRIAMVPCTRKYTTKIANPTADSPAATVKTIKATLCPILSSLYTEYTMNCLFTAKSNLSTHIKTIKTLRRFTLLPLTPIPYNLLETLK